MVEKLSIFLTSMKKLLVELLLDFNSRHILESHSVPTAVEALEAKCIRFLKRELQQFIAANRAFLGTSEEPTNSKSGEDSAVFQREFGRYLKIFSRLQQQHLGNSPYFLWYYPW